MHFLTCASMVATSFGWQCPKFQHIDEMMTMFMIMVMVNGDDDNGEVVMVIKMNAKSVNSIVQVAAISRYVCNKDDVSRQSSNILEDNGE